MFNVLLVLYKQKIIPKEDIGIGRPDAKPPAWLGAAGAGAWREPVRLGSCRGCQNHGPFLDPYDNTAPNLQGTPKGIIILTAAHLSI